MQALNNKNNYFFSNNARISAYRLAAEQALSRCRPRCRLCFRMAPKILQFAVSFIESGLDF